VKQDETGGTCSTQVRDENWLQNFSRNRLLQASVCELGSLAHGSVQCRTGFVGAWQRLMSDWVRWSMTASSVGLGSLAHGRV
jgi:hypothetical protein